jgi:hypothetical protein
MRDRFQEAIDEGGSHHTLFGTFGETSMYLRWCDAGSIEAFTQSSIEDYMAHLYLAVLQGTLKKSSYNKKRSTMFYLFAMMMELPPGWFNSIVVTDASDKEPYEGYSRSDLNQLLPFLRKMFNQTYQQLIANPDKHIQANKNLHTMTFVWKGETYKLSSGISKMMCSATYLLAYYTYINTEQIFMLKQPRNASISMGEAWYKMPAFKRRAFKTIQVEIGEHNVIDIPKYSMTFFEKLLSASRLINQGEDALLLQTVVNKQIRPIKAITLYDFFSGWVEKHFTFIDQTGRRLRPVISRFRETGSQLTTYYQGDLANDIMMNNTPNTRKKSYSTGNKHTNNGMLQDTLAIRQEQVQSKVSSKKAQQNLAIDVLVIEQEYKKSIPNLSRTPSGGSCSNPFGEKSEKYTRKALRHGLAKEGEKLACADLLECFGCPDQVIVQSTSDIWCLLSFKLCIEEALYLHLDAHHYRKNFEGIIRYIDDSILPNISSTIIKQAETLIDDEEYHPIWSDSNSILDLIPQHANKKTT